MTHTGEHLFQATIDRIHPRNSLTYWKNMMTKSNITRDRHFENKPHEVSDLQPPHLSGEKARNLTYFDNIPHYYSIYRRMLVSDLQLSEGYSAVVSHHAIHEQ